MHPTVRYVIVTPARNEAQFIELTLQSVIAQRVRPLRWVIVSDGSTDGTDEIVQKHAATNPWIQLLRMEERKSRDFAGKVHAFNAGYAQVRELDFEVVASLDADISFDPEYFAFLLEKLQSDERLGVVGTPFQELTGEVYDYRFVSIEHVSGACQVFRRECFEQIGGYLPVRGGSIDHIAVISARMKGWKTRAYPEKVCLHHRSVGTAEHSVFHSKFRLGTKDYTIGNHPLWEIFRVAYQTTKRPVLIGGIALGCGYISAFLKRHPRPVPKELTAFHRSEQLRRLRRFILRQSAGSSNTAAQTSDRHIDSCAQS
jgi:poly-beta-1,6-N-acetyl-D-glucosamine synthase